MFALPTGTSFCILSFEAEEGNFARTKTSSKVALSSTKTFKPLLVMMDDRKRASHLMMQSTVSDALKSSWDHAQENRLMRLVRFHVKHDTSVAVAATRSWVGRLRDGRDGSKDNFEERIERQGTESKTTWHGESILSDVSV